jgi:hypothetical protein
MKAGRRAGFDAERSEISRRPHRRMVDRAPHRIALLRHAMWPQQNATRGDMFLEQNPLRAI